MTTTHHQKVALVTGASSGMGEAFAIQLQEAGFLVYGVARRIDRMDDLRDRGIKTLAMDITDDESTSAGVRQILAETGRIDVLVNNAGYGSYGAVEDVPLDEARRQFEVNVFGAARLTQLVLPAMRRARAAPSSTSPPWAERSTPRSAPGTTPPIRARGLQRLPPPRDQAFRHQRRHHRTRRDPDRMERHRRRPPHRDVRQRRVRRQRREGREVSSR